VSRIDCRRLARVAKLLGAPADALAGLELHVRIGDAVEPGQPLFTLHAESPGELAYARRYLESHPFIGVDGSARVQNPHTRSLS
jgi:thymidine phosphorylase